MTESHIRNPEAVRDALRQVCARGELLILVTPYVRYESSFLRLDDEAFQVAATMSRDDALHGLRSSQLTLRFPYGFTFLEGATTLLGLGMARGRSSLRLAIPATLEDHDHRGAYRVDRVGRVPVTFSTRKYDLLTGNLVNISTTGARIYASKELESNDVQMEDDIAISIPLEPEIRINSKAKVRYVHGRSIGLEFRPKFEGPLLENLTRWSFRRREEDSQGNIPLSGEERGPGQPSSGRPGDAGGLVLVSAHGAMEDRLLELLKELPPLRRIPPTVQALRDLGPAPAGLLLVHMPSLSMEDRKRMRLLVEPLSGRAPFVLFGTELDNAALFEFGSEIKATATYVLGPNPGGFFPRLIQGILRRHFEAPPAGEKPPGP